MDQCASVAGAVACTGGYCVDSNGQRLEAGGPVTPGGPCDPLAPHELPVTLGTVLGVGKDAAGKTYMADQVPGKSIDRVFVSDGNSLVRKRVTGSGSSGAPPDADYNFSFEDPPDVRALLIQQRGGSVTGMALGPEGTRGFIGDPGAVTETLTVQDNGSVSAFALKNLPGDVTIEYVADVDGGDVIVVTRPTDDWEYTDFRLFYGSGENAMSERQVVSVLRSRSGGTDIQFKVDGANYTVRFTVEVIFADGGGQGSKPGPATLDKGGTSSSVIERFPKPENFPGFSFSCL
jgi:hypothetical protein